MLHVNTSGIPEADVVCITQNLFLKILLRAYTSRMDNKTRIFFTFLLSVRSSQGKVKKMFHVM